MPVSAGAWASASASGAPGRLSRTPIGFDASEGDTTTATAPRARAERRVETVGFADRVGVGRVAVGAIVTTFGGAVCGGTERRTSLGPVGSRTVRHM